MAIWAWRAVRNANQRLQLKRPKIAFLSRVSLSFSPQKDYVFIELVFILRLGYRHFCAESPAEFFAENKNIAGFDNVCLLFPYISEFLVPSIFIVEASFHIIEVELDSKNINFVVPMHCWIIS